jgi:hypothetical protein
MARLPSASFSTLADTRVILDPIATIPGVMFFAKDVEYRYVAMSPTIRQVIDLRPGDDPVGRTDFGLFAPLIAQRYREIGRLVIEEGRTLADEVHVVVARTGATQLVYPSVKDCPVVVDLHELSPVGGWPAGGRHGRLERFAQVCQG